ncbi:MAG: DEAD/DEAH box helicase [Caldilineaceae bacterium]|nr:DEAD/DEAH box helicase [Caldilineaceae bacterium]HRJ41837.1 DEAD/DEAH box helicase [Caldilineaceae bacterium]
MKFADFSLDARLNGAIEAVGYETPTPIQEQAIPLVLSGRDVLGLAQTGTGKTAAFALPILQRLTSGPLRKVRVLVVAPTRELAEQIHQTFVDLGKNLRVTSTPIYGGVSKRPQLAALRRGAEIVVACPGRLLDHIGEGDIDLSNVEVLVLDEADRMCDMGFLPDIRRILKHLPSQRQTLFFSATMPDDIRSLSAEILDNPATVQIGMIAPAETVSHAIYPITEKLKNRLLLEMLKQTATGRVLVFTRTKRRARNLALLLVNEGYNASALQGNMAQNRRQESIDGFRDGKYDIMVATDIASRGIDVTEISHVINFDITDTVDAYTHRIGRTGRAEQSGDAFTFVTESDEAMVRDIEKVLGEPLERRRLPDFDYGDFVPERQTAIAQSQQNRPASNGNRRGGRNHLGGGGNRPPRSGGNSSRSGQRSWSGNPRQQRSPGTRRAG